ncbi:MAG: hypothetical protein Q7U16_20400 [Agitococcus sp.]|nr:hypothetical protein [Agitococcus sp.]
MNHWLETSKKNITPLSHSNNFSAAQKEWLFTGNVTYGDGEKLICELCEHPDLSSHFEIKNEINENLLQVGSSCIKRFNGIKILDEKGNLVTNTSERDKILQRALRTQITDLSLNPLRVLWRQDETHKEAIKRIGLSIKNQEAISPSDILFILERMIAFQITYNPAHYKVNLRSDLNKLELYSLAGNSLKLVWHALSSSQKSKYKNLQKRFK